jgi:hypothetical protein
LKGIYNDLLAASILPICCTIPPHTGASANENKARAQLNTWICGYASRKRLPFVDFYSVLADPATAGNYLATYSGDGTHPTAAAAKVMGQTLATNLAAILPNQSNPLLTMNNGDTGFAYTNSLFLTDTNADGIPDNWTLSGTGATGALASDATIKGNYWTVTRGSADAAGQHTTALAFSAGRHDLRRDAAGRDGQGARRLVRRADHPAGRLAPSWAQRFTEDLCCWNDARRGYHRSGWSRGRQPPRGPERQGRRVERRKDRPADRDEHDGGRRRPVVER